MGEAPRVPGGFKPVLLWENSDPTNNFPGQEIQNENLKNFDYVLIFYRPFYTTWSGVYLNEPVSIIVKKGKSALHSFVNTFDFRNIEVEDDRIVFGDGKSTYSYGGGLDTKADNRKCVPLAIYGIR